MSSAPAPSFDILGGPEPRSPVVIAVAHAGRDYPQAMRAALRVPPHRLTILEDRHVDALALAARGAEWTIVARRARAWIDLNRSEAERDPLLDDGAVAGRAPGFSAKVASGLGLVPRRTQPTGDIWKRRLGADEVQARILADHRPFHAALAQALDRARRRFGVAVLLDLHSMPPLGDDAPQLVVGDRFGRSSAARFAARVEAVARGHGLTVAANTPYPGGHTLDAHADPANGIHALQIEIDRALYLDATLDAPGPGLPRTALLLRAIIAGLADEALPLPMAAE